MLAFCSTLLLAQQPAQPTQAQSSNDSWNEFPLQDAFEWYCTTNSTAAELPMCKNFGFWLEGRRTTVAEERLKLQEKQRGYLASLSQDEYASISQLSFRPVLLLQYCRHAPQAPQCSDENRKLIMAKIAHSARGRGRQGGKGRGGGNGRGRGGKGKGKGKGRGKGKGKGKGTGTGKGKGFTAASSFVGPRAGQTFKMGPHGLGYYADARVAAEMRAQATEAEAMAQWKEITPPDAATDATQGQEQDKGKGNGTVGKLTSLRFPFAVGVRVRHGSRGDGTVTENYKDGRTLVAYDSGEEHLVRVKVRGVGVYVSSDASLDM